MPPVCRAAPNPRVVVAIPARDEAGGIARTLRALGEQVDATGALLRDFTVLVLANNCADDTARVAREAAPPGLQVQVTEVTLAPWEAGIVAARRRVLDHAAALAGEDGVIVSTDADTLPAPQWLSALLGALAAGADAAAGRILLDPAQRAALPAAARRTHLLDSAYRQAVAEVHARLDPVFHDPWPRHWQHFGASLALSVRAYRAVGGVPDVSCLEDVALVGALRRADLHLRHTPQARAWTSARLSGRVPVGLSTQLTQWAQAGDGWTVPGAAETLALARAEAALRRAWDHRDPGSRSLLPELWRVDGPEMAAVLEAPTFGLALEGAHWAREAGGLWRGAYPPVAVTQALAELRAALPALRLLGPPAPPLWSAGWADPAQPVRSSTSSR